MEAMKLSAAKSWEESDSCNRHCLSSHGFVMLRGVSETMSYGPMVTVHKAPRSQVLALQLLDFADGLVNQLFQFRCQRHGICKALLEGRTEAPKWHQ